MMPYPPRFNTVFTTVMVAIALLEISFPRCNGEDAAFAIHKGDKVVFQGDSITDSQYYPVLVETYVLTRYPSWKNTFINRGSSGDNSGNMVRFERDVIAQKPDFLIYNMGFNDGGYGKLTSASLEKYLSNIENSIQLARNVGIKRILLASPIPNEVGVSKDIRWVSREIYPYVMLSFGREEEKLARKLDIPFVDIGLLYGQTMGLGEVAAGTSFLLSRDGVHPQREGQTLIAFHLLRGMGAGPLVANAVIDAEKGRLVAGEHCAISDLKVADGVVSFKREDESLPYPTPPEARPFAFLVRLEDHLSADMLTITGLTAPSYALSIDGRKIAEISAQELASGVNLSRYSDTPMYEQSLSVMDAVQNKQTIEMGFWRTFIDHGKADGVGAATDKATPEEVAAMGAARKAIAESQELCHKLNSPKPHLFRLEPSQNKVTRFDALENSEFNQSRLDVAVGSLNVDWNQSTLLDKEIIVTITNPGNASRSGTVQWSCPAGWSISPADVPFSVEPGKKQEIKVPVAISAPAALASRPELTVKWRWSKDWPYLLTIKRLMEIKPHLTIPRSRVKPQLAGNLEDWKDAQTFVLDNIQYIDPAVPGKKLLWNGASDLSAQAYLKWDEAALYMAVLVKDDEHIQNESEMMMWSQDCLMVALFATDPKQPSLRYEFGFGPYPDHDYIAHYYNRIKELSGPEVQFKSRVDKEKGTCLYEVILPWNRIPPFAPAVGKELPWTFSVSDKDSLPGKGYNYLEWSPGIQYGKNPADFAVIKLGE